MMKKVKKKLKSKKDKKSSKQELENGSTGDGNALSRTESQLSSTSSYASTAPSSNVQEEESRQRQLLENWSIKFGTTWASLESVKDKLALVVSRPLESQEIQELEEEYCRSEEIVETAVDAGNRLLASLGSEDDEVKKIVKRDLEGLERKWEKLQSQRYSALVSRVEGKEKHRFWKQEFDPIMGWIQEKSKDLDNFDDLESSLVMLEEVSSKFESLYAEINSYQEKIDNVVRKGRDVIKEENESDFVPSIRSDIRSLETTWEMLREKCAAIELNIKEKVAMRQGEEKEFMVEWDETNIKIEDWLSNAEKEAALFDQPRDNISEVEEQVVEHEELVFRLATEEKTINEFLDVGEDLLAKKLRLSENKTKLKSELKGLKKRKTKLNSRLIGQQESLTSLRDHLTRMESEVFDRWVHKCKDAEEKLQNLGETNVSDNIDTVDGAKSSIEVVENHLREINALKPEVDDVLEEGNNAIGSGHLGKLKRQGVRTAMKSLKDTLENKEQSSLTTLKEIQDELSIMQQSLADQVADWISKSETFDRWIDGELNQLEELLKFSNEEATLDRVLEEEQAIKGIQTNSDSRSSILEALIRQGNKLKDDESVQADLPDEHENVVKKLDFIQERWDVLQSYIKEKTSRVVTMVSEMQGQLLSVCRNQIDGLESMLNNLGPISSGYDTLAKDAETLSELFMMIGQTTANVERFDKYAKDVQTSEDLPVSGKFEVREAAEMLHMRISSVTTDAMERKSLLHERIIDVLTESLVALSETVNKIKKRHDELAVPDNLETEDLVERNTSLGDILKRLDACEVGLSDVEILGHAADDSMILEHGEADDIWKEIENRKAFIRRVKLMAREKKQRIYGLMVYSFMQRFDQLDKILTNIEEGVTEEQKVTPDIQTALERIRSNEASLEELDSIQKSGEELKMQVTEITDTRVITDADKDELLMKNRRFSDHSSDVLTALRLESNRVKQSFVSILEQRLNELRDWLKMMEKRREGDDQIGPDSVTIKKQIVEMNVVEAQCKEKRLAQDVHHDDDIAMLCLDQQTIEDMKQADRDWGHLYDWIVHRTKLLHATQEAWENFREAEVDILDYLREIERMIKTWKPIDLEDENAVAERVSVLKKILSGMEGRKDSVNKMQKTSDEVINLIGDDSQMSSNVKTQVADIHDCWNSNVRQVIEAISKLNCAKEKLQNLEEGISEVRYWLDDAKTILKFYTPDITDDILDDLKPKIEKKCDEEIGKKDTLRKVNQIGLELVDDINGTANDAISKDLKDLNKDWEDVTTDLGKKKKLKKKSCCWWCYRRFFMKYGYYF